MGRSRDIADMLSNTEISNTANERLLNEASNVGVDSAYVDGVVGQPLSFFSTLDSLPITSLEAGQQAYVSSNNRLYISDGSGWYQKAFITLSPTITMDPTGIIALASDGTTTSTVTVVAIDSDTPSSGLTYSVDSDGNGIGKYVISQDSSVFTIRPLSSDSGATEGTFALTFSATDGDNIATDSSSFSLTFQSIDTVFPTVGRTLYRIPNNTSSTIYWDGTGHTDGTTLSYSITGLASSDINNSLNGTVTWSSNRATFTPTYPNSWPSGVPNHANDKTGSITAAGLSAPLYVKTYVNDGVTLGTQGSFDSYKLCSIGNFGTTDFSGNYTRVYFGRCSNNFGSAAVQRFLMAWTTNSNSSPTAGNAGTDVYYRTFQAIKIWGIINGSPTHTHTFSWAASTGQMYAGSGQSGSNYYAFLYDIGGSTVTRDYTYSGYSNNSFDNMYAIQYFSNAAATTLINTCMWNGARGVIV